MNEKNKEKIAIALVSIILGGIFWLSIDALMHLHNESLKVIAEKRDISKDFPVELLYNKNSSCDMYRTSIPNGWLIWTYQGGIAVISDPNHEWLR